MSDLLFPKPCGCGASYSKDAWQKLPAVAVSPYVGFGPGATLERIDVRTCLCGTPIFISLPEGVSVCVDPLCGRWIEAGPRICTPAGVFCDKCGKAAVDECQRFSRSSTP